MSASTLCLLYSTVMLKGTSTPHKKHKNKLLHLGSYMNTVLLYMKHCIIQSHCLHGAYVAHCTHSYTEYDHNGRVLL